MNLQGQEDIEDIGIIKNISLLNLFRENFKQVYKNDGGTKTIKINQVDLKRKNCRLKNKAQRESCDLSFIWGKMRTIAWETASQIVLRNCS